ncbi:MAG: NUDIX domain-containing protein [Acidobacteria bacterium]|nr:NUDIX domain-containing protein [Acidobacteriota bacterium]
MSPTYEHPRPALTVDCVVFAIVEEQLKGLLIRRAQAPFIDAWALPGGFVDMGEDLEAAARRELEEETGLADLFLEQLYTFGSPARDPRGRVVSVAYYALADLAGRQVSAASDAAAADWFAVDALPELAFDHAEIFACALERLRGKVRYAPLGFELLPGQFTLTQLQRLYEIILGRELDKRNFRRKILALGPLVDTGRTQRGLAHRAPRLYRFDRRRYRQLERDGFNFWL